jgi:hypothetical protein
MDLIIAKIIGFQKVHGMKSYTKGFSALEPPLARSWRVDKFSKSFHYMDSFYFPQTYWLWKGF